MTEHTLDTIPEFHMQHPDDQVYALIAHMISVLETHQARNIKAAYQNISNMLGEGEATRILKVMCQVQHVDYLELMKDCQSVTLRRVSPRLLLHIAVLPVPFVASQLQIDQYWAGQLLDQLHKHFTIDDPIVWLKSLLSITEQERMRYSKAKEDVRLGRAVVDPPADTAEYRRTQQWHRLRQDLKPPGSPH